MAFLKKSQLLDMNFKSIDLTAKISDKAVFYNPENISIGAFSRIDDFAILSAGVGGIEIGEYVHVGCHATIIGGGKVTLSNFSGISGRVSIYSSSDPYDGSFMTNPCVPAEIDGTEFRRTYSKDVFLGKHVVVGAGSIILPGINIPDYCAVGAMSLVTYSPTSSIGYIIAGIPANKIKPRNFAKLKELEGEFYKKQGRISL